MCPNSLLTILLPEHAKLWPMDYKTFTLSNIKNALKIHYSAPLQRTFGQFRLGAACFFTGGVIIWISQRTFEASVLQELVLLVGMMLAAIGFFIAMMAQIRHIIIRFVDFFND